jgi:hypothetical protein
LNPTEADHIERLRAMVLQRFSYTDVPEWLIKHTKSPKVIGAPFSFKGREYQLAILKDPSQEKVVIKPSQVGISELTLRVAVALANIISPLSIAYTLPTAGFASLFVKTRLDPIINTSPYLKANVNPELDNSEVKGFGDGLIYFKGCAAGNAAISIPVDVLIHDEVDFSDSEVLTQYESRITASEHKMKFKLSTPTVPGYGIHEEFANSRRNHNFCKCNHCNHWFLPDYWDHVKIPGYKGDLHDIKKANLPSIDWQNAVILCPNCGKVPSLMPEHREWVVENPGENHVAAGWAIQPFDAPTIVSIPSLVKTSTNYSRAQDFSNFALGKAMEDKDTTFSREELNALFTTSDYAAPTYVIGLDLGLTCHLAVGAVASDGSIFVVHTELIPIGGLKPRLQAISAQWNVSVIVSDSQPYFETILSLQERMPNLWGAVYNNTTTLQLFQVKLQAEDDKSGKTLIRQVTINRDRTFDAYMDAVRQGKIGFKDSANKSLIIEHHLDMKRVKTWDKSGEIVYTWSKSKVGNDHFHHTCGAYLYTASQILGTAHVTSRSTFSMYGLRVPEKVLSPKDDFFAPRRVARL